MATEPDRGRGDWKLIGGGTLWDGIAYWSIVIGVYVMVGGLMFYSGKGKLFDDDGNAPQGIKDQFQGTFLSHFPGTDAAWVILGILEFAVFALLLVSLMTGEFFPHRRKYVMQAALAIAMITFAFLAFGQTATGQHEGSASLYQYFGSTVVILILVSLLPPNRGDDWLRGQRP